MRGKGTATPTDDTYFRITPAYAGKSQCNNHDVIFKQDHPRLCGEKFRSLHRFPVRKGSPPPMRGKDIYASDVVQQAGITPAYAGKSAPDTQWTHHIQDHPRLCGEKLTCLVPECA